MEKGPRMCVPIKEIISVCFIGHFTKYVGAGAEMRTLPFDLGDPGSTPYLTKYVDLNFQYMILAIMRN